MDAQLALSRAGTGAIVSHRSAAQVLGIDLVDRADLLELTVPRNRSHLQLRGVRIYRATVPPAERTNVDGLAVTAPLRTIVDLARVLPFGPALAAADAALRADVLRPADLAARASSLAAAPGAPRARRVLSAADPLAGSVLESLFRALIIEADLPRPVAQFALVERGRFVGRFDFAWPRSRVLVELDGFEYHSASGRFQADRDRSNAALLLGWQVLRFTWADLRFGPAKVVATVRHLVALAS